MTRRLTIGCEFVHQADIDTPAVLQVEPLSDQKVDVIDARWSLQLARIQTSTAIPAVA